MRPRDARGRFVKLLEPKVITAAAAVVATGDIDKLGRMASASALQTKAWRLWRILGVLNFPTTFKAKQVGRLKWNVEVNGEPLDEENADEAIAAITAPMTPQDASTRLALNLEVAGEVWYARIRDEWTVLAATTPKVKEILKTADIAIRGWQPDPERPNEAFSAVLAALNTADAIRLMLALSRSQDRNRVSQRGILLKPTESQFPDDDPFDAQLQASITAPIADEYAAAAVVPLVVDTAAEYIDKWKLLTLDSPYDDKLMTRIQAAITQLAIELDMPPEMLLGNMDSNHWNAWLSSEENYRAHVEPLGVKVGEVYAKAMMEAASAVSGNFAGAEIVVTPDPADLLTKAPSVPDAMEGAKIGAVGLDFVRRALDADEEDAPTEADIELMLRLQGKSTEEPEEEEPVQEAPEIPEASPNGNGQPVTAAIDDEDEELDILGRRLTDIDVRLLSLLEGLTAMAVGHARDTVAVGEVRTEQDIADEVQRLGKAWNREVTQARKVLSSLGIEAKGPEWDEAQQRSVNLLTDGVAAYIAENLGKAESEMPALPVLLLRDVLAAAGGSGTAVVAAPKSNPAPTFADPQGFAIGVLPLKALKGQGVELVQWRFRYGPATRTEPFQPHKDVDGQFMTRDGYTSAGWYPGDHRGCECGMDPVLRRVSKPATVREGVA